MTTQPGAAPPAEWLTSFAVASILSVSNRTLWRLVAAGRFPQPERLNRKIVRFRRADVYAWLDDPEKALKRPAADPDQVADACAQAFRQVFGSALPPGTVSDLRAAARKAVAGERTDR